MGNIKGSPWYGGGTVGITGKQPSAGSEFYVSGTGLDTNPGTKEEPFLTITAAIAACVAGNDDYIFVLGYAGAGTETWPIPMTKSKVHVIGTRLRQIPRRSSHHLGTRMRSRYRLPTVRSVGLRSVQGQPELVSRSQALPGKPISMTVGLHGRELGRMESG